MFFAVLRAEWLKARRAGLLLPTLGLPLLGLLIGTFNFSANRSAFEAPSWQAYWTQAALFYGYFFYPVLLSICAAALWRVEHRGHNWNRLLTTPVPVRTLFAAKFSLLAAVGLLAHLFLLSLYALAGVLVLRFDAPFPLGMAAGWAFYGWFAGLSVAAFQLYLSLRIRSFAVPVGVCLCCCILGLGLYVLHLGAFFPHSLVILGMGSTDAQAISPAAGLPIVLGSLFYIGLFFVLAVRWLKTSDASAA